jgi:membrane protease YdiL (CAAX protease family)
MASTNAVKLEESSSQQGLPDRRRRWEDLALVMLIGFLPLVMSGIYRLFVPPVENAPAQMNWRFSNGLVQEFCILFLFVVLLRRQGRRLSDIGLSFHWLDILRGAVLAAGSWMLYPLALQFIRFIYSWFGLQPHYRSSEKIFAGGLFVLDLAYTTLAPFFEEILVRGYLMTELIGLSWPVWLAMLTSVVLQTSYHLYYGVAGALAAGSTFLISAIYFAKTRRLTPVVLSHLFWNLAVSYNHWNR